MKTQIVIEQLLRWRLAKAVAEAPSPPRAQRLLETARPWWETWPEQFQLLVERVGKIQLAVGHAMAEPRPGQTGHPIAVVVTRSGEPMDASARVLYFDVREGRLRIRFLVNFTPEPSERRFEVTFVADPNGTPLFSAVATVCVDSEYRLDAEISAELAQQWEKLKVTDRMPFRLILRPAPGHP